MSRYGGEAWRQNHWWQIRHSVCSWAQVPWQVWTPPRCGHYVKKIWVPRQKKKAKKKNRKTQTNKKGAMSRIKERQCWRLTSAMPADAWITTTALHFIGVIFCCAACLEVSSALEESPILHRGPQARRVKTTTTLLVARARTQTCSRVHSICWRRPSHALMLFAPIACMHAFCRTTADTLKNPTKILVPCKPRYIPLECIRWIDYPWGVERFSALSITRTWLSTTRIWQTGPQPWPLAPSPTTWW